MELLTVQLDARLTLTFTVPRPVTINRMYARRGGNWTGKGLFTTSEGRAFKNRVRDAAIVARAGTEWPQNLWRVRRAELSFQLYDFRGDVDGPRKATKDALEGILYVNDRVVQDGPAPLPIRDGAGARMVITIAILELISGPAAVQLRDRALTARIARERRKRNARG